jgi:hypothetical protein
MADDENELQYKKDLLKAAHSDWQPQSVVEGAAMEPSFTTASTTNPHRGGVNIHQSHEPFQRN